jgi:FkbM family methyltransferase
VTAPQHLPGTLVRCTAEGAALEFFVTNPRDPIQACHLRGEFFEPDELRLIAPHIPPGAVIADIGANIGNHALFFEHAVRARRVVLFEANPDAAMHLRLHGRLNRCRTWDESFLGLALAAGPGRMARQVPDPDNPGGAQFHPDPAGATRCIPGDAALAGQRVDFIKIDVEGGEMAVLAGLAATVACWQPTLFIELCAPHWPEFNAWLDAAGYRVVDSYERYPGLPNLLVKPA